MNTRNDGGQAFPRDPHRQKDGMSLRDWIAAQALVGMNANPALLEAVTSSEAGHGTHYARLSRHAYAQADAMLAERDRVSP